jgi:phosphoglycolate phosphatase
MKKLVDKKLFIFDLDGTLADCFRAIEKSLNFTLRQLGYSPVSYIRAKMAVGHGDKNFVAQFVKKADVPEALTIYRQHHAESIREYSRLKPYAKKLLLFLKRIYKNVAIASNRPKKFTDIVIKSLGIEQYIDFVLCADEIRKLKPHPKLLNTVMKRFKAKKTDSVFVGDMDIDLEAAKRAKTDAIFILGGSSHISTAKKYKNKVIVHSLKDIIEILKSK